MNHREPLLDDPRIHRAERALLAIGGAAILLFGVYVIGMSGIPGEAFTALIDWAVARHPAEAGSPVLRAALAAWG